MVNMGQLNLAPSGGGFFIHHEETRRCFFIGFLCGLRDLGGETIIRQRLHAVLKRHSFPDSLRNYQNITQQSIKSKEFHLLLEKLYIKW